MNRAEELMINAFENLDVKKLQDAISLGADINGFDPDGYSYWYSCLLERYSLYDDDKYISENKTFWERDKAKVISILRFAYENGLNINVCDNDIRGCFYPTISFLAFGPFDLEFVDFLISIGFDPVSKFDSDRQFDGLIFYLEDAISEKQLSRAQWLWELGKLLLEKFPLLKENYDILKYRDSFIF